MLFRSLWAIYNSKPRLSADTSTSESEEVENPRLEKKALSPVGGGQACGFTVCLLASYCIVSSVDVCLELCMCPVICRSVKLLPGIGLSAKNDC